MTQSPVAAPRAVASGAPARHPDDSDTMGQDAGHPISVSRSLANDAAQIHAAATDLISAAEHAGYTTSAAFALRLALEEAVRNAFEHGCRSCPGRSVDVSWEVSPRRVVIRVSDPGPGFDPAEVPDPTTDENLDRPSGRGLLLMRAYMTRVEFNERGNTVTMTYDAGTTPSATG